MRVPLRRRLATAGALITAAAATLAAITYLATPAAATAGTDPYTGTFGWDGDKDAAIAHLDGSFQIRDGRNLTATFGIFNAPSAPAQTDWTDCEGYLPCFTTAFSRSNASISITNFGDKVTIGGADFVLAYSRVKVTNNAATAQTFDPAGSSFLTRLNNPGTSVAPGATANFDYVVAIDRFGGSQSWPAASALTAAGSYDSHYGHMRQYWNDKLAGIVQLNALPDPRLVDAYKAGYITMMIVKDGNNLNVGENGYDRIYDHDLIGLTAALITQGDLGNMKAYLDTITYNEYPDAKWKFAWPFALYLARTGDTAYVNGRFNQIRTYTRDIEASRTGPGRTMAMTNAIDSNGYWLIDDEAALTGLVAYRYIATALGQTAEATWAAGQYTDLLAAVNNQVAGLGLTYLPCAVNVANTGNRCSNPTDANWAATMLFGQWSWDGYLLGAAQNGPLLDRIDATYDYGMNRLATVLPADTFGGYPGLSTAYNAGYGSAALRGTKYRSQGIRSYQFMIDKTTSAPYSWWEGIPSADAGPYGWTGSHATAGTGSSPHMWGQSVATKVLLDSLAAQRLDGTLVVGRGVPDEWLRSGKVIDVSNIPLNGNQRTGIKLTATETTITFTLTGSQPTGGTSIELPVLRGNIAATTAGTADSTNGVVTLPTGTTSATVTLATPVPTGNGLKATYYANRDFTGPLLTRIDPKIDFTWGAGAPGPGVGADNYAVRWSGVIQPKYSEMYTFLTTSDDGIRLWVNGALVVDNWTDHASTVNTGTINLTAGAPTAITVEYYEATGGAIARLEWASAREPREVVPTNRLISGPIIGTAGKCLDVADANPANGTRIQLYTCNGTTAQNWTRVGQTWQTLGKCLDVAGGLTADGTNAQLYECNGTAAQNWTAGPTANTIVNPQSGRCLAARNGSTADGTQIEIRTCAATADMRWTTTS